MKVLEILSPKSQSWIILRMLLILLGSNSVAYVMYKFSDNQGDDSSLRKPQQSPGNQWKTEAVLQAGRLWNYPDDFRPIRLLRFFFTYHYYFLQKQLAVHKLWTIYLSTPSLENLKKSRQSYLRIFCFLYFIGKFCVESYEMLNKQKKNTYIYTWYKNRTKQITKHTDEISKM
jgi:hypothetical protein